MSGVSFRFGAGFFYAVVMAACVYFDLMTFQVGTFWLAAYCCARL